MSAFTHSVRRRFIDWLKSLGNHLVDQVAKLLRSGKAHPQPAGNVGDGIVVRVNRCGSQPEIDNSINGPSFTDQINEVNRNIFASQFPPFATDSQIAAGFNYNFVLRHQPSPIGFDALANIPVGESSE